MIHLAVLMLLFCVLRRFLVTSSHVTYVVDPAKLDSLAGYDWGFLLSPFSDLFYVTLMAATVIVAAAAFVAAQTVPPLRDYFRGIHDRFLQYHVYVPTTLRSCLGVALIVAGTKNVIFVPNVPGAALGTVEVVLGYSLLVGFMTRLCGLGALAIYFYGLNTSHYLLGAMESAAVALLVVAVGADRPSADDLLQIDLLGNWLQPLWTRIRQLAPVILRVALGSTLLWLAITEKAMNPRVSEAVVIDFELQSVIPVTTAMWVLAVGMLEFAVGLILILGLFTRTFCVITALILTLSFFYFKEEVVGHVILMGSLLVLMATGAGKWSLDAWIARRSRGAQGTAVPYQSAAATPPTMG